MNQDFYILSSLERISLLALLSDCIILVIKPFYSISDADNYWFTTYHIYHKKKLEVTESIYNSCLFYKSGLFDFMEMQTNEILILTNNDFASNKKNQSKQQK